MGLLNGEMCIRLHQRRPVKVQVFYGLIQKKETTQPAGQKQPLSYQHQLAQQDDLLRHYSIYVELQREMCLAELNETSYSIKNHRSCERFTVPGRRTNPLQCTACGHLFAIDQSMCHYSAQPSVSLPTSPPPFYIHFLSWHWK